MTLNCEKIGRRTFLGYIARSAALAGIGFGIPAVMAMGAEKTDRIDVEERIESALNQRKLAKWQVPAARGIIETYNAGAVEYADHYGQDIKVFMDIMAQESGYKIDVIGPSGERGTSQFLKSTADGIAGLIADPESGFYHPDLSLVDYGFTRLSSDYGLNNLMKAAYLKYISGQFEDERVDKDQMFADFRKRGMYLDYSQFARTGAKLDSRLKALWRTRSDSLKDTLVFYAFYNNNGDVTDKVIYRMSLLMKNAGDYAAIRKAVLPELGY